MQDPGLCLLYPSSPPPEPWPVPSAPLYPPTPGLWPVPCAPTQHAPRALACAFCIHSPPPQDPLLCLLYPPTPTPGSWPVCAFCTHPPHSPSMPRLGTKRSRSGEPCGFYWAPIRLLLCLARRHPGRGKSGSWATAGGRGEPSERASPGEASGEPGSVIKNEAPEPGPRRPAARRPRKPAAARRASKPAAPGEAGPRRLQPPAADLARPPARPPHFPRRLPQQLSSE